MSCTTPIENLLGVRINALLQILTAHFFRSVHIRLGAIERWLASAQRTRMASLRDHKGWRLRPLQSGF
jgi:hypothetical protein